LQAVAAYPKDTKRLLWEHRQTVGEKTPIVATKLIFNKVGNKDVYNPCVTFKLNGQEIMGARVESRHSETDTEVKFFTKNADGSWDPVSQKQKFKMQDPFVTVIGKETVIGGVETFEKPGHQGIGYRTVFYKGTTLANMQKFAVGPDGMKDIRLLEQKEAGNILVFTRPQGRTPSGENAGRGKIGVTTISSLEDLNPDNINKATLFKPQFTNGEWGGTNEIHQLKDGKVGVLGHIARFDKQGKRHYYPATFIFDPLTGAYSPLKILLERSELPAGHSKREDLEDVLFSGGLKRHPGSKMAELYIGGGDAETYHVVIEDPFQDQ